MIVAIEGPDCAGKTTLLEAIADSLPLGTVVVRRRPSTPETMRCIDEVNLALEHAWRQLYDPGALYVCDRFFAVSDPVYTLYHGRRVVDYSYWYDKVCVVYLEVPTEELVHRHRLRGDELFDDAAYEQILRRYDEVLASFKHVRLRTPTPQQAFKAVVDFWCNRV